MNAAAQPRLERLRRAVLDRLESDHGLGLIEVMVAVFILSVALVALASVSTSSLLSIGVSSQRQQATAAATRSLELARSYDYAADLAMHPDDYADDTYDPDGPDSDSMEVEDVVSADWGATRGLPHWGTADGLSIETYVTWVDDDEIGDHQAKRVTAVVTWQYAGESYEVRQSTIVAAVARGA